MSDMDGWELVGSTALQLQEVQLSKEDKLKRLTEFGYPQSKRLFENDPKTPGKGDWLVERTSVSKEWGTVAVDYYYSHKSNDASNEGLEDFYSYRSVKSDVCPYCGTENHHFTPTGVGTDRMGYDCGACGAN
jgi:hypothetical protein